MRQGALRHNTVDLKPYFFDYTLCTTTELLFGESLDTMSRRDRNAFRDGFDYASRCCGARIRLADLAPLNNTQKFRKSCEVVRHRAGYFSDKAMKYMKDVGDDAAFEKYTFVTDLWR